ncbi:MAG: hypothetical protein JW861_11485 [Bacteroidales bacterium]|nr:hypothetical protein [Bacteroidales bacterium]
MKVIALIMLLSLSAVQNVYCGWFDGDVRSWKLVDFLGFDPIGDHDGPTGDIASAFARQEPGILHLRLTFDNMVERNSNQVIADRFRDIPVHLELTVRENGGVESLRTIMVGVSALSFSSDDVFMVRTPGSNMLEIGMPWQQNMPELKELALEFRVMIGGRPADEMKVAGKGSKDTGNCAFVHHGNQGFTFTEVFYGSPWGISGMEGSGYDEVLQVHETTQVPGNFHMSGTLMPAAAWHNPEFNTWLMNLASQGIVSMMSSALGQHIMPFFHDSMNNWSVYIESQMVDFHYNYSPHVAWIPERVWLAQGYYPDAGVLDWLGDNWTQHGIWGVVLDDWPHLNGYDNRKIHWMNNGSGVTLRVIPINNSFVGNMQYDATAAKNQIASMGQFHLCVYGTDWEVAAEMNEHDGTFFLDNYENVIWYCHDNYPGVNVWKLEDAIMNPDFNGTGANITKGTYSLLGGTGGYGGSNNSWYINWASTPSRSDFHYPQWDYGTVWNDAWSFLMGVTDNSLAQLAWYTMMINLHETGWHSGGQIADWEHRYSSHVKNANVYTEASRWADGQFAVTTACYLDDIDHDGTTELVIHNDKVFMVFERTGGKANWVFYKTGFGQAFAVVGSDMAYWSETEGDFNESSNNHVAALSDVSPNQQHSPYNIIIHQSSGDTVSASLDQWGVVKTVSLTTGKDFLDVVYQFYDQTGYVKSGWSPDLLDLIRSGKSHLDRLWGGWGSYCGYRNSSSGATAALVLGNGGAHHHQEFEGTLVRGDEVSGYGQFMMRLYAGYTSSPSGTHVPELDVLASQNMDVFPPVLFSPASVVSSDAVLLSFSEALDETSAELPSNYSLQGFSGSYTVTQAERQADWSKVMLTVSGTLIPGDAGEVVVVNVEDLYGNVIGSQNSAAVSVPDGMTPHTIQIDGVNDFIPGSEMMADQPESLYITWDANHLYVGYYSLNLNGGGDFFVNIDTDQLAGSGATSDSWGRVDFAGLYLPEYHVAIEGGGGSMQVNHWTGSGWNYPGNGAIGNSYEGWESNGLTEISVPWADLGNPGGVAISVYTTEEDNHTVTAAYPGLNPVGNHPVITYCYGYFQPYISGMMPLVGMVPNQAVIVPNSPPVIISFQPPSFNVMMAAGTQQLFSVNATDPENDPLAWEWVLDGTVAGATGQYLYQPLAGDVGMHLLEVTLTDMIPGHVPDTLRWNIEVTPENFQVSLRVWMDGPFLSSSMSTGLNTAGYIPLTHPFGGYPWYYNGTETVTAIPSADVVDWVLVELRETSGGPSAATGATMVARQAGFILNDGHITSLDGISPLNFTWNVTQDIYAVIRHRNHLGVMTSGAMTKAGTLYSWDFTTSATQFHGGVNGCMEVVQGQWGMPGGDGSSDGQVNNADKVEVWVPQAGLSGYLTGDYNLDVQVNNSDKIDVWNPATGKGTQVPE